LERAIEEKADIIISSAGVSVGAFDYVKPVVEADGELDFWKVNMRPGKPLAFGNYHGIPFFGLPGNPVSAYVGFEVFVRPALEKASGQTPRSHPRLKARLAEPIESDGRESYLRVVVTEERGRLVARLTGHQGSGNIFSLVQANALLIVPSGVKSLPATSEAEIWLIQ
jgi:molybdopterin molybdotransferase